MKAVKKKKKNLSENSFKPSISFADQCVGIVVSEWNPEITSSLLKACKGTLIDYGVAKDNLEIHFVPGSFELPGGAKMLLSNKNMNAVICLGCIIKGETKHDEYISQAVAHGLTSLSIQSGKPVIFGVLTPNTLDQAIERAGGHHGNKGIEAAISALKMIQLSEDIKGNNKSIGF